jgi:putative salt-induced outer membrane protein YdiY
MNISTCNLVMTKQTKGWRGALLWLLALVFPVWADNTAQAIITTNTGDRLSGRVLKVKAEQLEIETTYAGRIRVRAAEIKSWQTDDEKLRQQLALVWPSKAIPPITPVQPVAPSKPELKLALNNQPGETKKPATTPSKPVKSANKEERWQRSINLAYMLSRGNANVSDLNGSFSLARKRGQQRTAFSSLGRYGVRNGAQVAHLSSSTLRYENVLNKLPTFSEMSFEIDRIKQLDYRFSESVGVTYPALKREGKLLSLDIGTGITHEVFRNGQQRTVATSLLRATAEQKLNGKAQLSQQVVLFSDLLDPDNYRMQTDVSLTMPITKYLGFRIAGLNRFDNRPAAAHVKQNDFSLLTGFNINF